MLVSGKNVIGHKVITTQNGKEIDTVQDLIYDPAENRVKALLIDKGGIFSDAWLILIEDIKSIGEDAVMVETMTVLRKASHAPERVAKIAKKNQYLTKATIVTEEGKDLGKVSDIFFDPATGKVEEFEVTNGLLKNVPSQAQRIKVADILTMGEDATIVRTVSNQAEKENLRQPERREEQKEPQTVPVQNQPANQPLMTTTRPPEGKEELSETARETAATLQTTDEQREAPHETTNPFAMPSPVYPDYAAYQAQQYQQYPPVGMAGGQSEASREETRENTSVTAPQVNLHQPSEVVRPETTHQTEEKAETPSDPVM